MSTEIQSSPTRGRPRCFDLEEALDRSLLLFWEKGFQNTSLDEIAEAVGVKKPSLYAAFGDKEMLFRKVLQRYSRSHRRIHRARNRGRLQPRTSAWLFIGECIRR